jgi:hypothetical protein
MSSNGATANPKGKTETSIVATIIVFGSTKIDTVILVAVMVVVLVVVESGGGRRHLGLETSNFLRFGCQ